MTTSGHEAAHALPGGALQATGIAAGIDGAGFAPGRYDTMQYRRCGRSGLMLPVIPLLMPGVALSIGWAFLGAPRVGFVNGILAPAKTPRPIIDALHREIVKVMAQADTRERLATLGFDPIASTPEEFSSWIGTEVVRWTKVIRDAKITAD